MLKIKANSIELDLGSLAGISLRYNPGLFEIDSFTGSYSIPFNLPSSSKNNKSFNFQHKLNASNREVQEVDGEIWHSGILMAQGIIKATKYTDKQISCNFYVDNGEIFKKLNELNLPENDFGGEKEFTLKQLWDPTTDDYVIYPVINNDYYDNTIYEGLLEGATIYQNKFESNNLVILTELPSIITPFPLLWRVLQYLFTGLGFNYTDSFFSVSTYRNINIFNTVNAIKSYQLDVSGEMLLRYDTPDTVDIANHLPDIPTTDFIKAIQSFFNIIFYIKNGTVIVIDRKLIIESTDYDDLTKKQVGTYEKTLTGLDYDGVSFNMSRDNNDLNVSDLVDISDFENIYETTTYPDDIVNPEPYETVLYKASFADYNRYINRQDVDPEYPTPSWFWYVAHINYRTSLEHLNYCNQMGIFLDKRQLEINTGLSCLSEVLFGEIQTSYTNYVPKVLQQGNSPEHSIKTPFSLRLMQYRGRQSDVEGSTQPHGAYYNGTMSLTAFWSYYQRWESFITWYKEAIKEEYTINLKLNASEIKNFDFSKKKLINGNLFFVTNIQVQLTRSEIKPAICTLLKV